MRDELRKELFMLYINGHLDNGDNFRYLINQCSNEELGFLVSVFSIKIEKIIMRRNNHFNAKPIKEVGRI